MPAVSADWLKKLQDALEERGWSQNELARQLDTDSAVVSRWFTGKQRPGLDLALKIQAKLGVPADMIAA